MANTPDNSVLPLEKQEALDPIAAIVECSEAIALAVVEGTDDFMEAPWLKKNS